MRVFDYTILKEWRQLKGMTQVRAAEFFRVGRRTWQQWESGKQEPQMGVMRYCDVEVALRFGGGL